MAENRRGKENRFYFSRGQMVLLGGAFIVTAVIVFFIGMFVGQGIEERKLLKKEEPLVKIPVKPPSQESSRAATAPAKDEITFNESPSKSPGAAAAAPEKTVEEKPPEKVTKPAPKENKTQVKVEAPAAKAAEKKIEKSAPAEETPRQSAASETAAAKDPGKVWRAQVNAYPDERSAKQIVDRLKDKGYNAYVSEAQNKGKTWYRVSVGKYGSREEAEKMVEALRSKESFTKAFSASK